MKIDTDKQQACTDTPILGMQCYAQVFHGDCLELYKTVEPKSIDLILTDLPYGTTACKWDTIIPFDKLWEMVNYLLKPNGAFITTASQPFTSALVMSNISFFKYCMIWEKSNPTGMGQANKRPMKYHEDICVFYSKQPTYNKQMIKRESERIKQSHKSNYSFNVSDKNSGNQQSIAYKNIKSDRYSATEKNPSSIIKINSLRANSQEYLGHETQKPVALFHYLLKTYSNDGMTIFDPCMGSGTTGVACKNLNRNFIGIEKDENYFKIAEQRINARTLFS